MSVALNATEEYRLLKDAIRNRKAIPQISLRYPGMTLEEGYEIQRVGLEERFQEGAVLSGYKMGLTSLAKQRDVNVHEPIRGYLLKEMEVGLGEQLAFEKLIHPRVEPEVAVILQSELKGPSLQFRDVEKAVESILPAVELLDSRFEAFQFRLPDVVADNTSACGYLLGTKDLRQVKEDLRLLGVVVKKNGVVIETGAPAAVLGHPFHSVIGLVQALYKEGKRLLPGMVVLTGGITASVPIEKGDTVEMMWPMETLRIR